MFLQNTCLCLILSRLWLRRIHCSRLVHLDYLNLNSVGFGWFHLYWIYLFQCRHRWLVLCTRHWNLSFNKNQDISWPTECAISFSKFGLLGGDASCCTEFESHIWNIKTCWLAGQRNLFFFSVTLPSATTKIWLEIKSLINFNRFISVYHFCAVALRADISTCHLWGNWGIIQMRGTTRAVRSIQPAGISTSNKLPQRTFRHFACLCFSRSLDRKHKKTTRARIKCSIFEIPWLRTHIYRAFRTTTS